MPTVKKMTLEWLGDLKFVGKNENGLTVNFDVPVEKGGHGTAPSPMETLLACLAACSSIDVVLILKKKRQDIRGLTVEVSGLRRDEDPKIYTKINLKYIIKGVNVNKEFVESAIKISHDKYCSVGGMLKKAAEITTSYEIIEEV
ncbi:MAG: OsmC family protein [Nitrososphaeria archaeon]|nr:OsmC family protein [Nitrososphaeria archaeon]